MLLPSWAKNGFHLALVAACGITASAVMFRVVKHLERSRAEAHFHQVAEQRLSVVRTNVAGALETVSLLASYFEASGSAGVDRHAFSTFVAPALAKHRYIQALEWIPRVEGAARPEYERLARSDGLRNFSFTEAQAGGAPVVAGPQDEYFPVFYVEPFAGNERALGYNLAWSPTRLAALQQARDSGQVAATERVPLVQEKANQYGFLVFAPVYSQPLPDDLPGRRQALKGFALGVFRIGDFISSDKKSDMSPQVVVHVFDPAAPESQRQLHPRTPETTAENLSRGLQAEEIFEVGGLTWLLIATPGPGWRDLPSSAGVVLLTGLLASGIYLLHLRQRMRHSARIAMSARKLEIAQQKLTEAHRIAQLGSIEHVFGTTQWRVGEDARAMLGLNPTESKGELPEILRNVNGDDQPHLRAVLSACNVTALPVPWTSSSALDLYRNSASFMPWGGPSRPWRRGGCGCWLPSRTSPRAGRRRRRCAAARSVFNWPCVRPKTSFGIGTWPPARCGAARASGSILDTKLGTWSRARNSGCKCCTPMMGNGCGISFKPRWRNVPIRSQPNTAFDGPMVPMPCCWIAPTSSMTRLGNRHAPSAPSRT